MHFITPLRNKILSVAAEVLDSYSILLFSGNRFLGGLLLLVSFFKPFAGFSALASAITAIMVINISGLQRSTIHKGLYSFNAVLIGMGMGAQYASSLAFWTLLLLLIILSVILSAVLGNILLPKGLPFLTIPFVICFWILALVSRDFTAINLSTRNIHWLSEIYAFGGGSLVDFVQYFEKIPLPALALTFFRSLSCMLFQENVLSGLVVFLILLWHSRIATSLAVLGFITGQLFNGLVHANDTEASQHLLNVNFMAGSMAIGSFFLIPSFRSYMWAVLSVPCVLILMTALGKMTGLLDLTSYSLPFSITTILLVYFIQMLRPSRGLVITPQQFYSPEKNLYDYINARKRLFSERYMPLQLPFIGEWIVSQGYDSDITHKGDWSKALDFVIVDSQMKTYSSYAAKPENFYCYGKPVLSPADGYVQEIIDHIEDNEVGKINRKDNWGNTIVISHGQGLFTKMSHLKKGSFKVRVGDRVRSGEVLAACGNSGRSPEPHLHFQVQLTPYVGSKTYPYPFQSFITRQNGVVKLVEFAVPEETRQLSPVVVTESIATAFDFAPGYRMHASAPGFGDENWEAYTDAYNLTYLYCHQTGATAYFNRNQAFFYFTAFYGDRTGLLYQFYLSCYKISFCTDQCCTVEDEFPLHWTRADLGKWLQDLIAPFYIFRRMTHRSDSRVIGGGVFEPVIQIISEAKLQYPRLKKTFQRAAILIEQKKIVSIQIESRNRKTQITCKSIE